MPDVKSSSLQLKFVLLAKLSQAALATAKEIHAMLID